jgi:NADH-quinone oxidoreductase subunit I
MDTGVHPAPYDTRDQFIFKKDLLMAAAGRDGSHLTANPRHEPGDSTHPGVDREHAAH